MTAGSLNGFRRAFRVALLGACTAVLLVGGLCVYALSNNYQRYCETAEQVALSLSQGLETYLRNHFQAIDLALQAASAEFAQRQRAGRFDDAAFSHYIASLHQRLPDADSVRGANRHGAVIYGEGIDRGNLQSQGDREFFQRARDEKRLIFGPPAISRISGQHLFPVVMPLLSADGQFGGTAYVNTAVDKLAKVFSGAHLGQHGIITLFDPQGRVLVRYPPLPDASPDRIARLPAALTPRPPGQPARAILSRSPFDGLQRTVVMRQVGHYPLYFVVGLAQQDYLAPWRNEILIVSLVFAGICLLTLLFCLNIRRRWHAEIELGTLHATRMAHEQLSVVLAAMPDSIFEVGRHGQAISVPNDRPVNLFPPDSAPTGKSLQQLLPPEALQTALAAMDEASVRQIAVTAQITLGDPQDPRWFELSIACRHADAGDKRLIIVSRDITERKLVQAQVEHLAFSDLLTLLPNRRLFMDRLRQSMSGSQRGGQYGAVLFLDLDHFKAVNDTLGHSYGDELLVQVATRLRHIVREEDTVARLGGDEFVVILEQLAGDYTDACAQAMVVGEKIVRNLAGDYTLKDRHYNSTVSVGVTLFLGNELSVEDLLKRADTSMYQAKHAGRNGVRFFDPATQASIEVRNALESDLRRAAINQEFILYYQPQINAHGRCTGVEALIRWQSPNRGMVPPNDFIPVAEDSGLILLIGHWVIAEACRRLQAWRSQPAMAELEIAVNVSARQFAHPNFVCEVAELLEYYEADPQRLTIEVTESMLISGEAEVIARMNELRAMGIGFALDDFGTGYSSLAYLKRLPLCEIKIDRSFTDDILTDPYDDAICRAILAIANTMDLEVVAEGIETLEQWHKLHEAGCHYAQGYHFARPMPEAALIAWVEARQLSLA